MIGRIQKAPTEVEYVRDKAYITAMFVAPQYQWQGIGSQLLRMALDWFRAQGRKMVLVSPYPYTRHYFFPGVDVNAYAAGYRFLQKHGFTDGPHQAWMSMKLLDFRIPPEISSGCWTSSTQSSPATGLRSFGSGWSAAPRLR